MRIGIFCASSMETDKVKCKATERLAKLFVGENMEVVFSGVGNVNDPTVESWGGQFQRLHPQKYPNYYIDLDATAEVCQSTISRWRVGFLSDWKQRWLRY